jgi:hypothetical protein
LTKVKGLCTRTTTKTCFLHTLEFYEVEKE